MSDWYISDEQGPDGPYSLNDLKVMLRDGELGATEQVQQGVNGEPTRARDVPELRSAAGRAPRRAGNTSSSGKSGTNPVVIILAVFAGIACLSCLIIVPALLLPAVQQVREAARRSQSQDHLHNILIAMHEYEMMHQVLPPGGIIAADGTEHHGWGTFLLPYLEQQPLYSSIDVEHSHWREPLVEPYFYAPIDVYLNPSESNTIAADGLAAIHFSANANVFPINRSTRLAEIIDGTSNTMFIGEIGSNYPAWGGCTNMRDLSLGLGQSSTQFGRPVGPECQIGLGDGATRLLSESIDLDTLSRLSTYDDGQPVYIP